MDSMGRVCVGSALSLGQSQWKRSWEIFQEWHIILLVCGTYPLSMHRVTTQFHRFQYIFNCCMLIGQLCLKIVSTCLSGRIMEVSFLGLPSDRGSWGWPWFPLSPIKYHVMSFFTYVAPYLITMTLPLRLALQPTSPLSLSSLISPTSSFSQLAAHHNTCSN
jgi:hypothetical protein